MNYLRTSTVGIDSAIQPLQIELYDKLVLLWGDNIDGYGRIFKNLEKRGEDFIPEVYIGNNEFRNAFHHDKRICTLLFIDDDVSETDDQMVFISNVKCVFMVNLLLAYPTDTDRADTTAQRDVIEIMRDMFYSGGLITGVDKSLTSVFSGFKIGGIKFLDIQPYHCFSVNIDLSYNITDKCS